MVKRTTLRSSKGTKLYAVRGKEGKFEDIQTYKRAHGQDIKRKSAAEKKAASHTVSSPPTSGSQSKRKNQCQ